MIPVFLPEKVYIKFIRKEIPGVYAWDTSTCYYGNGCTYCLYRKEIGYAGCNLPNNLSQFSLSNTQGLTWNPKKKQLEVIDLLDYPEYLI